MHGATGCWIRDAIVLACSLHLKLEASDVESNGTQEARNPGPNPPECGLERPPPRDSCMVLDALSAVVLQRHPREDVG